MPITLPTWIKDLRQPIAGDSFSWAGLEPPAAKKSIIFHHSASPNNQDGFDIAGYHVHTNGWGGCGYHLVITHDSYPGRPGLTAPGAQVQYVGDLATWRAHVENNNPGRVGICLVGNMVNGLPGPNQLKLARAVVDYLLSPNNVLPSLNYFSQVNFHNAVPGQATACPGWQNPNFNTWFNHLKGGPFPAALYPAPVVTPPPAPLPPPPPVAPVPEPGRGSGAEWVATWKPLHETKSVRRENTHAFTMEPFASIKNADGSDFLIPVGTVVEIGGYFWREGVEYARTQWATETGKWNGIPLSSFEAEAVEVPVTVTPVPEMTPDQFLDSFPDQINNLPEADRTSFWHHLRQALAILLSPLLRAIAKKDSK